MKSFRKQLKVRFFLRIYIYIKALNKKGKKKTVALFPLKFLKPISLCNELNLGWGFGLHVEITPTLAFLAVASIISLLVEWVFRITHFSKVSKTSNEFGRFNSKISTTLSLSLSLHNLIPKNLKNTVRCRILRPVLDHA